VQVEITCRHGSISDSERDYFTEKSGKLLTYFERVTAVQVTVDYEGDRVNVEMLFDAEHKHNFVASDVGESTIPVFDSVLHKMEQQVKKYKAKLQDHRRDISERELVQDESTESEPS